MAWVVLTKPYAELLNQKLKRQLRLGDAVLHCAKIPDCDAALRSVFLTISFSSLSTSHRFLVVDLIHPPSLSHPEK